MLLEAIKYSRGNLEILDQTLLPEQTKYIVIRGVEDGWRAINSMQVRGAPAIAMVGVLSLAVELTDKIQPNKKDMLEEIRSKMDYLVSARPTAVNIKLAARELVHQAVKLHDKDSVTVEEMLEMILTTIEGMMARDLRDNQAIGDFGAREILQNLPEDQTVRILTHCNTGSLATTGYGTALGVVRSLHRGKRLEHVYCTETRPYNQGARLTAYELVHEDIPATLICDNMVAALMKSRTISAVVVGADRVAKNGDTANKIGTYQIAIVAKNHDVPFYVAAPTTSIDFSIAKGDCIPIEERPEREMTHLNGQRIAAPGIKCWNPSFDVTPAQLIAGIITERGVFRPEALHKLSTL